MKKTIAMLLAAALLVALCAACGGDNNTQTSNPPAATPTPAAADPTDPPADPTEKPAESETPAEPSGDNTLNLMDMYTVTDPEGVEYDQRTALYAPVLEAEESYAMGARYVFEVFYGKDGKGVYLYTITVFENEDQANAYLTDMAEGEGTVDGNVHYTTSDAAFFTAMEAFIPDLQTFIDNNMASGFMPVE